MDVKIERGLAPATGFAESAEEIRAQHADGYGSDPLSSIAAATQEAQMLYELTQDLGNSLSLQEALAFVGVRLKRLIPYETIAVYIRRDEKLDSGIRQRRKSAAVHVVWRFRWARDFPAGWRKITSRFSTAIRRWKPGI